MKDIRFRNWLILGVLVIIYLVLLYLDIEGFWSGFMVGSGVFILVGELYWIIRGKDINNYILRNKNP